MKTKNQGKSWAKVVAVAVVLGFTFSQMAYAVPCRDLIPKLRQDVSDNREEQLADLGIREKVINWLKSHERGTEFTSVQLANELSLAPEAVAMVLEAIEKESNKGQAEVPINKFAGTEDKYQIARDLGADLARRETPAARDMVSWLRDGPASEACPQVMDQLREYVLDPNRNKSPGEYLYSQVMLACEGASAEQLKNVLAVLDLMLFYHPGQNPILGLFQHDIHNARGLAADLARMMAKAAEPVGDEERRVLKILAEVRPRLWAGGALDPYGLPYRTPYYTDWRDMSLAIREILSLGISREAVLKAQSMLEDEKADLSSGRTSVPYPGAHQELDIKIGALKHVRELRNPLYHEPYQEPLKTSHVKDALYKVNGLLENEQYGLLFSAEAAFDEGLAAVLLTIAQNAQNATIAVIARDDGEEAIIRKFVNELIELRGGKPVEVYRDGDDAVRDMKENKKLARVRFVGTQMSKVPNGVAQPIIIAAKIIEVLGNVSGTFINAIEDFKKALDALREKA